MTAPNTQDMKRLQAALNSHRRKAEALGLPADDVRAHQLLAKADGTKPEAYSAISWEQS